MERKSQCRQQTRSAASKVLAKKTEQNLHKLKIETVGELLEHYPRNYDEIKPVYPIEALEEGDIAAVEGVLMARYPQIMKRGSKSILTITLRDTTGSLLITWFNMPFLRNQLKMGTRYLFRGKVEKRNGRLQMVQPKRYTRQEFYKIVGKNAADLSAYGGDYQSCYGKINAGGNHGGRGFQRIFTGGFAQTPAAD